jgi:hypothetical protein
MSGCREQRPEIILPQKSIPLPKACKKAYHHSDQQGLGRRASIIFSESAGTGGSAISSQFQGDQG